MTRLSVWIVLALAMTVAGCGAIMVSSPSGTALDGVPFYVKVPVVTHETKWVKSEMLVSLTLSIVGTDGKETDAVTYPPSGAVIMSPDDRAKADRIVTHLYAQMPGDSVYETAKRKVSDATDQLTAAATKSNDIMASNTWAMNMIVGPDLYYINTRQPLIGTASGTYKQSSDGTLTEATASVTDDTVKTILSLFPINAKLSQDWGIKPAGAAVAKESTGPVARLKLVVSMVERRTISTLRAVEAPKVDKDNKYAYLAPIDSKPLTSDDEKSGKAQLVSREVVTGDAPADDKSKTDTSYKIQGTFTPPKAPDAK